MVEILFIDTRSLSVQDYEDGLSHLNPTKRKRVLAMRHAQDQKCSIAADIAARRLISKCGRVSFDDALIKENADGRPFADDFYISLSHSGTFAVCAVADCNVGVDIERLRETLRAPLAKKICSSDEERIYVENGDFAERLITLWSVKEACFKALDPQPAHINDVKLELREKGFFCEGIRYIESRIIDSNYIFAVACGEIRQNIKINLA